MNTIKKIVLSALVIAGAVQTSTVMPNAQYAQNERTYITLNEFAVSLRKTRLEHHAKAATLLEDYARETYNTSHVDTIINDDCLSLEEKIEMLVNYIEHFNSKNKAAAKKAAKNSQNRDKQYYAHKIKESVTLTAGFAIAACSVVTLDNLLRYYLTASVVAA